MRNVTGLDGFYWLTFKDNLLRLFHIGLSKVCDCIGLSLYAAHGGNMKKINKISMVKVYATFYKHTGLRNKKKIKKKNK